MYRLLFVNLFVAKKNLFINYVCYYPDFLSAKYVKQAFPYPSKKIYRFIVKVFFIIDKILVSKNASNLMNSPSFASMVLKPEQNKKGPTFVVMLTKW